MRRSIGKNSTIVRALLARDGAPAVLWLAGWIAIVGALAAGGALERVGGDVPWIAAFAAAFALLACAVDAELRRAVETRRTAPLVVASMALAALLQTGYAPALLVAAPVTTVCAVALLRRLAAARASSAPAGSPAARRAAP